MNNSMTLDQAKSKVLEMNNETLQNFVNERIGSKRFASTFRGRGTVQTPNLLG